ncbi:unnamed protein product [Adineta steineri]|uniref:Uncharacterized protein n=1 Tax=Adineta steineri TaxID=433720 RepID=A0A815M098_9BILA|nr:unnamed protein product [Adineta steineri]CAF3905603.1 unnamed protein product [Adineta steineri]
MKLVNDDKNVQPIIQMLLYFYFMNKDSIRLLNKTNDSKTQPVWRSLSPKRPAESISSIPQASMIYKSQQQINDRRQSQSYQLRYQTMNTASILPLMSGRSDVNTSAKII